MRTTWRCLLFGLVVVSGTSRLRGEDAPAAVAFAAPVRLKAGEALIDTGAHVAHAGPVVVDLDGDTLPDLLVGNFRGHVQVYRNVGTRAESAYADQGLLQADGKDALIPNW